MNTSKIIQQKKGFTLIELLVVVAILGLLSSIATVALNNARIESRNVKRIANLKQLSLALELYKNKHDEYPYNADLTQGGYGEGDGQQWGYIWDKSCYGNGTGIDPFLTPLVDDGIIAGAPDYPLAPGVNSYCYLYSSTRPIGGGNYEYIGGYYLITAIEPFDASTIAENNCPGINFAPYSYITCISGGFDD